MASQADVPNPSESEPQGSAAESSVLDRRARILDIAVDEFAKKGFAGARIDEIARRSNANKQLIYYYYGNKAGLHEAVMQSMMALGFGQSEESATSSYSEIVKNSLEASFSYSRYWHRFWAWEALETSDVAQISHQKERHEYYEKKLRQVREAQDGGEIDDEFDPEFLYLALLAIVAFPHVLPQVTHLVTGLDHDGAEFRARQEKFMAHLMKHLTPPA